MEVRSGAVRGLEHLPYHALGRHPAARGAARCGNAPLHEECHLRKSTYVAYYVAVVSISAHWFRAGLPDPAGFRDRIPAVQCMSMSSPEKACFLFAEASPDKAGSDVPTTTLPRTNTSGPEVRLVCLWRWV